MAGNALDQTNLLIQRHISHSPGYRDGLLPSLAPSLCTAVILLPPDRGPVIMLLCRRGL